MPLFSPIHHTFGPLADKRQRRLAIRLSYLPWKWKRGMETVELAGRLQQQFHGETFLFSTGREALLALLQALKIAPGEEVIVQAYTCVVVPNAIQAAGMIPVYCEIEKDTLNLDLEALKKCITSKTRVVICQHTFGIPANVRALRELCDQRSLILIEDCAHILPDESGPSEIGSVGDFLLLSFGRDKAISGITGGAVVCKHPEICPALRKKQEDALDLSKWQIGRLLEYPNIYALARPLYGIGIGKAYLKLMRMLRFLLPILNDREKESHMSTTLHRMPNACAALALDQWNHRKQINDHRRMLTKFYLEESQKRSWPILAGIKSDLPLQKFPMFVKNAEKIRLELRKENIHLWDGWTGCVVCPATVDIPSTGYELGNDPIAEEVCEEILSLPTHPEMTIIQASQLMRALDPHLSRSN